MNPRKYKDNVPQIAENNELDPLCVRDMVDFYWKQVRQSAGELVAPRIQIQGLGSLQIYKTRLRVRINEVSRFFEIPPEQMTFQKHAVIANMERTLALIKRMQSMIDADTERLNIIKQIKYGKIVERGLEKPKKYSRRYIEQLIQESRNRENSSPENGDMPSLSAD